MGIISVIARRKFLTGVAAVSAYQMLPCVAKAGFSGAPGLQFGPNGKIRTQNFRLNPRLYSSFPQVMASPPTITFTDNATSMSSPFTCFGFDASIPVSTSIPFFAFDRISFCRGAKITPVSGVNNIQFDNVTATNTPTYTGGSAGYDFYHDGQIFELVFQQNSTYIMIKVDDQFVSLTPQSVGTTGGHLGYIKVAFGSVARRRISVIGWNTALYAINVGQTDSLDPAPIRGPRLIVVGDSFAAGVGATGTSANGVATWLGESLGCDDAWASGVGGTGLLATNSGVAPTYRGRIIRDVINQNPEIVLLFGCPSINDNAFTPSQISAEATLLFQQLVSSLPNTIIFAAPDASGGVNLVTGNQIALKNAAKAAATATGVIYLDLLEYPIFPANSPAPFITTGTLTSGISAGLSGATGFNVTGMQPTSGMTYDINNGAERVQCKSSTQQAANIYKLFFDGSLQNSYSSAAPVKHVGGSFWTGHGNTSSPNGFGNCDNYINGAAAPHWSDAGHQAGGRALASLISNNFEPN